MKPKIWFMAPDVDSPTGGTNNCYRLCSIAEELNIEAKVLSPTVYRFADPQQLKKYWQYAKNSFDGINTGDIIITPEIWRNRPMFNIPIRHVVYIQNWAIAHSRMTHEHLFWYYGGTHLNYAQGVCGANKLYHDLKMGPTENMETYHTAKFINKIDKIEWFRVQPYFDNIYGGNNLNRNRNKAMIFSRRCPAIVEKIKKTLDMKVTIISDVNPQDMPNIYNKYGVLILPTPAEGLCYPAIEALMSGTAVVSWPCGAPEEYLINNETAIMVPFGDTKKLIRESDKLLNDPHTQIRLANKGNKLVRKMFSKEQTKTDLYLAYHSILRHNPRS